MLRRIGWSTVGMVAACLIAGGISACHGSGKSGSKAESRRPSTLPVEVVVVRPTGGSRDGHVSAVVEARHDALMRSRVSGRIVSIPVRLGQRVRKGDLLIRLSGESQGAAVRAADATLLEAEKNYSRIDALFRSASATRAEWDRARKNLDVARAEDQRAHSVLGWSAIRSPFSGMISGKFVREGDTVAPGTPLVEVIEPGRLRVEAHVPSLWTREIRQGEKVSFKAGNPPVFFPVIIREIAAGTDPVTHTVRIRADVAPSDARKLRPGEFGTLFVPVGKETRFLLPPTAVLDKDGLKEVFVVENNRAYLQYVRTGEVRDGKVEILSGLSEGETVVVHPGSRLENGAVVTPEIAS